MSEQKPCLVVITPVFNEEAGLARYRAEVERVLLASTEVEVRILLIDDGSRDGSWALIERICGENPRFSGLRLSRNFGAHAAIAAGFDHVHDRADAVAILACDLQDPPETVMGFVAAWRAGAQIVWGRRSARQDTGWRVLTSQVFNLLVRRWAMPRGSRFTTGSFLLADRQVVECVRQFGERNRITWALVAWTGFQQEVVDYERRARTTGRSGWTLGRMLSAMYDTFVGFSPMPIRLMTWLGILVSLGAGCFATYLVAAWFLAKPAAGWTSVMLLVTIFFGLQFLLMGLVGEYLYRIYTEAVRRPLYFVSRRAGGVEACRPPGNAGVPPARPAVDHAAGQDQSPSSEGR